MKKYIAILAIAFLTIGLIDARGGGGHGGGGGGHMGGHGGGFRGGHGGFRGHGFRRGGWGWGGWGGYWPYYDYDYGPDVVVEEEQPYYQPVPAPDYQPTPVPSPAEPRPLGKSLSGK